MLLNIFLGLRDKSYPLTSIGVFHQDFEAQYRATTEYIEETFRMLKKRPGVELYWLCLPVATRTALSSFKMYWCLWDDRKEILWVRPIPECDYIINLKNNPVATYHYKMHQEDLAKQFGRWYRSVHDSKKTICLLGLCANESVQCYSGFVNKRHSCKDKCWVTQQFREVWTSLSLYDWSVKDIWHAYYKFGYNCDSLYDLYHKAGLTISQMRVISLFQGYAKGSLNLCRVIDPQMQVKLLGRAQGASFAATYARTKAVGYRAIELPEGHTWKSYTMLLSVTLPKWLRQDYIERLNKSITFWYTVGGGPEEETTEELKKHDCRIKRNGVSNYTIFKNSRIISLDRIPDDTSGIKSTKGILSRKRMCFCVLRNDRICYSMGLRLAREQQERPDHLKEKCKGTGVQMMNKGPVYHICAVPIEKIIPNNYNLDVVAPPEMKLLYDSIKANGYTTPIVCCYDEANDHYIIVSGFHRYRIMKGYPDIYERGKGVLPVSVINKPLDQRMASTIRHNRARDSHDVDLMSNIVRELHELGRSDAQIAKYLDMNRDEILKLKQIIGLVTLSKEVDFSQSWEPVEDEEQLQSIEGQFVDA